MKLSYRLAQHWIRLISQKEYYCSHGPPTRPLVSSTTLIPWVRLIFCGCFCMPLGSYFPLPQPVYSTQLKYLCTGSAGSSSSSGRLERPDGARTHSIMLGNSITKCCLHSIKTIINYFLKTFIHSLTYRYLYSIIKRR